MEIFNDNIEWADIENEYIPFSGTYHGKAGVAQYFQKMADSQESIRVESTEFLADGDKVVVYGTSTWRVKSTGRTYDTPWAHITTLKDGKAIRFQQYNDTASVVAAFMPTDTAAQQKDSVVRH